MTDDLVPRKCFGLSSQPSLSDAIAGVSFGLQE